MARQSRPLGVTVLLLASSSFVVAGPLDSVVTPENYDAQNTLEVPPNANLKGFAASRDDQILRAIAAILPRAPHGGWSCGQTTESVRHFRLAFKMPLRIGTVIGGGGEISILKATAQFPGDVKDETQWIPIKPVEGQAGLVVTTLPPNTVTQAVRFTFRGVQAAQPTPSSFGGARLLSARFHNLTPEADAYASSQRGTSEAERQGYGVRNLLTGGRWTNWREEDITPDKPEWVILTFRKPRTFRAIGFLNAFAKRLEIDAYLGPDDIHPTTAPAEAWKGLGGLNPPVSWRPAYEECYFDCGANVTTRALRLRITQPLTNENPDVSSYLSDYRPGEHTHLDGVMVLQDLGDGPVPQREKEVVEPPPLRIRYRLDEERKVAFVINTPEGKRVKNLVADVLRKPGNQEELWDGADEEGKLVAPGKYVWQAVTHRPLQYSYQFTLYHPGNPPWWKSGSWGPQLGGGWLSDHAPPNAFACIKDKVFVGASIAESGHSLMALDLTGRKLWGTKWLETAGAQFVATDNQKVYTAGEGGWIGARMMAFEIDPDSYAIRRVTQLVYDNAAGKTGGLSGLAVRDGLLYLSFQGAPRSPLASNVSSSNLDLANCICPGANQDQLLAMLRTVGVPTPHQSLSPPAGNDYLRLAFKEPQAIGTVITPHALELSLLKPDAQYPGDVTKGDDWLPIPPAIGGAMRVYTAPPRTMTRALRIKGKSVGGMRLLGQRFTDVLPGASITATSGATKPDGSWSSDQKTPITEDDPARLTITFPEVRTFRGLALLEAFAKRMTVEIQSTEGADWDRIGEVDPPVWWRPAYHDCVFDPGREVSAKAIRLNVVAPLSTENGDVAWRTGSSFNVCALGGLAVLKAVGEDPTLPPDLTNRISVFSAKDGTLVREYPVPSPSWPTFDASGRLFGFSGNGVVRFPLEAGQPAPVPGVTVAKPQGLAIDAKGTLYVSEGQSHQIRTFVVREQVNDPTVAPKYAPGRSLGKPGGQIVGPYDPQRLNNPAGLGVDSLGHLWVAENEHQPKRITLWDPAKGTLIRDFIGHCGYGHGFVYLDPRNKSRAFFEGMEFSLNWEKGTAALKNITYREGQPGCPPGARNFRPVYRGNDLYLIAEPHGFSGGSLTIIARYVTDHAKAVAAIGNAEAWPPLSERELRRAMGNPRLDDKAFLWSDKNDDGKVQVEEVQLSPKPMRAQTAYFGSQSGSDLSVQLVNVCFTPAGFTKGGAPLYDFEHTKPTPPVGAIDNLYATAVTSDNRVIGVGSRITVMPREGEPKWAYPDHYNGVHRSQGAPAPRSGLLVGSLSVVGQFEPNAEVGETFTVNGNKGEWYLFTTDGIYAARLFGDYRSTKGFYFERAERGMDLDEFSLGEEHFGGTIAKTGDGHFIAACGHNHNSLVEIKGLDTMKRMAGEIVLTPKDAAECEAYLKRQAALAARAESPKFVQIKSAPVLTVDGDLSDWKEAEFVAMKGGAEHAARAALMHDKGNLYLAYDVTDADPMQNASEDWKMLFKTGDSVDLQMASDWKAPRDRQSPVPGDQRLLISVYADSPGAPAKPIAVLYKHRVPGTPKEKQSLFSSPWRSEAVDSVDRLTIPVAIKPRQGGYIVEAAVPLRTMGLAATLGRRCLVDLGVLFSAAGGGQTSERLYWANKATGVVSDVPSEIMLTPALWGEAEFR